jgi:hypothetical protein
MWNSAKCVAFATAVVIAAAGCDEGGEGEDETLGGDCVEDTTVIGPTDATGLGFTAQDVLVNIVGSYPDTLQWSAAEGPAYYVMPDTSVGLSVDVSFGGGEVRYVEATPQGWCDGACADYCVSRVEIDGFLGLATADGVLDESWDTVFTATSPTEASFYVLFDPDQTQGTLSPESFVIGDGSPIETLIASGYVHDGITSGSIAVQIALQGEGGGFGVFDVGEWPPP